MPLVPPDAKRASNNRTPSTEVASEDFLFHLYRGSELLQDNRVHEAKEELEAALQLQPLDAKGQDLLGVVYFRLGMYPRAIEIFEQLVRLYPEERGPRVNLALCYLKTGQPQEARQLLEATVLLHPDTARAWGYLGLAYERLGDYVKAHAAFLRGGHMGMSRRMEGLMGEPPLLSRNDTIPPSAPEEPFQEIDDEQVEVHAPPQEPPKSMLPPMSMRGPTIPPPISLGAVRVPSVPPPSEHLGPESLKLPVEAPTLRDLSQGAMLVFPRAGSARAHEGLISVASTNGFACRLGAVRAMVCGDGAQQAAEPVVRRLRGRAQEEPLGGQASPLLLLRGVRQLLLGPMPGRTVRAFVLEEDYLYLREELLVGFDEGLSHDSGRLPFSEHEGAMVVQLSGTGVAVIELSVEMGALDVREGEHVTVRRELVLGWSGHLTPRQLAPSEAAIAARGLVQFQGEGVVLIELRLGGHGRGAERLRRAPRAAQARSLEGAVTRLVSGSWPRLPARTACRTRRCW